MEGEEGEAEIIRPKRREVVAVEVEVKWGLLNACGLEKTEAKKACITKARTAMELSILLRRHGEATSRESH